MKICFLYIKASHLNYNDQNTPICPMLTIHPLSQVPQE